MLPEYKVRTNYGIGVGLLMQLVGNVITEFSSSAAPVMLGLLVSLAGLGVFIWGCISYAQGKGHHGAWGLLGLLSLLGLIILILFPDRHK